MQLAITNLQFSADIRLDCTLCLKNVPPLVCYNFDTRERILIFFWQKCYR